MDDTTARRRSQSALQLAARPGSSSSPQSAQLRAAPTTMSNTKVKAYILNDDGQ